jgi:hypothetical protein
MEIEVDITVLLKELVELTKELKMTTNKAKQLRAEKKEYEQTINEYLKESGQPGIKYGNLIIFAEEKPKRITKKKKEKEKDTIKLLESAGVKNPEEFYKTMIESFKGEKKMIDALKLKSVGGSE